jgi:hypothetical protein
VGRNSEQLTFSLYEKVGDNPEVLLGRYGELWRLHERCSVFAQERINEIFGDWHTPELGSHYIVIPKIRYRIATRETKEEDFDVPQIERPPLVSEWIDPNDFLTEISDEGS